jgi:hypothetical protein
MENVQTWEDRLFYGIEGTTTWKAEAPTIVSDPDGVDLLPTRHHKGACRLALIPEWGGKSRIATVHYYGDATRSEMTGKRLRVEMARHPSVRDCLAGDPDTIELAPARGVAPAYMVPPRGWDATDPANIDPNQLYVFSADLTAATDTIRHDVLEVFCAQRGLALDDFRSKCIVHNKKVTPVTQGTDLGLGGSFPALCLIHASACEEIGMSRRSFRVKGDDLIGMWYGAQIIAYLRWIAPLTGMAPNLKKTMVCLFRGLYCEQAYKVHHTYSMNSRTYYVLTRLSYSMSLKLLHVTPQNLRFGEHKIFGLGEVLNRAVPLEGRVRVWKLQTMNRYLCGIVSRFGAYTFLPASLGGLGLVTPTKNQTLPVEVLRYARAIANGGLLPPPRTVLGRGDAGYTASAYVHARFPRKRAYAELPQRPLTLAGDHLDRLIQQVLTSGIDWNEEEDGVFDPFAAFRVDLTQNRSQFLIHSARILAENRERALALATFAAVSLGALPGPVSAASLVRYHEEIRELSKTVSNSRIKPLTVKQLNAWLQRSVWVPREPKPTTATQEDLLRRKQIAEETEAIANRTLLDTPWVSGKPPVLADIRDAAALQVVADKEGLKPRRKASF